MPENNKLIILSFGVHTITQFPKLTYCNKLRYICCHKNEITELSELKHCV